MKKEINYIVKNMKNYIRRQKKMNKKIEITFKIFSIRIINQFSHPYKKMNYQN